LSSSFIYHTLDKNGRGSEVQYLDSLGNNYFGKNEGEKRVKVSFTISMDNVEMIDKYRKSLGLSRSRYVDYVIRNHFTLEN
jgi:hypothetical protein